MSTPTLESAVPLPLDPLLLEDLQDQARDYACAHGIVMRTRQTPDRSEVVCHAPFTLLPSPFPRTFFEKALKLQEGVNLFMYRVSQDREFLKQTLARTIEVDDFTGRLFKIYQQVHDEKCTKPVELGLLRTDYLLDTARGGPGDMELSMVEINTMAASFGGLVTNLPLLHRFVLNLCGAQYDPSSLPDNRGVHGLAQAMVKAAHLYGQPKPVILFVIIPQELNIFDQRQLEYAIRECDPRVKVIRRTLTEVGQQSELRDDRRLFVDNMEVSVVYYRASYIPSHYPTELEWTAKLVVEQSRAAVCPSISWHLAGTKKVQQELAKQGVLERFIQDQELASLIRTTFAGQYSLDMTAEGDDAAKRGIATPEKYVMKPQREGGGNNIYDDEVRTTLEKLACCQEREAYILMDRIVPPIHENYNLVCSSREVKISEVVSELGIFGTFICHNGEVQLNKTVGHLLRTKDIMTNEGGVSAGASCLDSPFLI